MEAGLARRRLLLLAPLGVAAAGGMAFWTMLDRMGEGRFDPHDIGNPMLGKAMPSFDLGGVGGGRGFTSAELLAAARGKPVLLNFFASWCVPCAAEAETLALLAGQGVQIWGIAYEDKAEKTKAFLEKYGNPYARLAADGSGGTFIDFGLFGVPESFVIDGDGKIAWHLAGPVSEGMIPGLGGGK